MAGGEGVLSKQAEGVGEACPIASGSKCREREAGVVQYVLNLPRCDGLRAWWSMMRVMRVPADASPRLPQTCLAGAHAAKGASSYLLVTTAKVQGKLRAIGAGMRQGRAVEGRDGGRRVQRRGGLMPPPRVWWGCVWHGGAVEGCMGAAGVV
eukprot:2376338-Pleurochrysis_carterae.AAC.3